VARPINSNLHRKRRFTLLTLKNGHAQEKQDHYTCDDAKENDFFFFLFSATQQRIFNSFVSFAQAWFSPFYDSYCEKDRLWEQVCEKRQAERKRGRDLDYYTSFKKNRYFLLGSDYIILKGDTNTLANVISGYVRASLAMWIKI